MRSWRLAVPRWAVRGIRRCLLVAQRIAPARVARIEYVRRAIELDGVTTESPARIEWATAAQIDALRSYPNYGDNPKVSGFRLWEHGVRRAAVWYEDGRPLCIQWVLTADDNERMRRFPGWSGLYLPLAQDEAQVENLFSFTFARKGGSATEFMFGVYRVLRGMQKRRVVSHFLAANHPALRWADRVGMTRIGTMERWTIDAPVLRDLPLVLHIGDPPG